HLADLEADLVTGAKLLRLQDGRRVVGTLLDLELLGRDLLPLRLRRLVLQGHLGALLVRGGLEGDLRGRAGLPRRREVARSRARDLRGRVDVDLRLDDLRGHRAGVRAPVVLRDRDLQLVAAGRGVRRDLERESVRARCERARVDDARLVRVLDLRLYRDHTRAGEV